MVEVVDDTRVVICDYHNKNMVLIGCPDNKQEKENMEKYWPYVKIQYKLK